MIKTNNIGNNKQQQATTAPESTCNNSKCDLEDFETYATALSFDESAGPIFCDGSALFPQLPLFRIAGFAVVQLTSSGRLWRAVWGPVPTSQCPTQSAADGEVFAVYALSRLRWDTSVGVYSDCQQVTSTSASGELHAVQPTVKHAHLWCAIRDWPKVTKVKAHVAKGALSQHGLSELLWYGNDQADRFAKKGARCHGHLTERAAGEIFFQHL
eukprot:3448623-Amphidinium_carterae.1